MFCIKLKFINLISVKPFYDFFQINKSQYPLSGLKISFDDCTLYSCLALNARLQNGSILVSIVLHFLINCNHRIPTNLINSLFWVKLFYFWQQIHLLTPFLALQLSETYLKKLPQKNNSAFRTIVPCFLIFCGSLSSLI